MNPKLKSKLDAVREIEFSLEPMSVPFTVKSVDDKGQIVSEKYLLNEPTEADAVLWRDALVKATRFDEDGKPVGISGVSNTDALLLSLCLRKIEGDKKLHVEKKTVLSWPARIVKPMVEACREMGGFDDEEEDLEILEKQLEELTKKVNKLRARQNGHAILSEETAAKN